MGDISKAASLPDSSSKSDFHDLVDNATINSGAVSTAKLAASAVTNAKVSPTAAIDASKINFNGVTTAITYSSNKPKRTIILTAAGGTVPTTNGAEQAQTDSGTEGQPSYWTLNYDKTTDEHAYWTFIMPDSYDDGNVTVYVYWTTTDTTANSEVQWDISFSQLAESDAIDAAMGTSTAIDDTIPATGFASGDVLISDGDTVTGANFGDAGDLIICKLTRDVDGPGGVDVNADAKVICVKIEYSVDQETD